MYRAAWSLLRHLGGVRPRHLVSIGITSLVGGLLEAALIFLVIRIALAMSSAEKVIDAPDLIGVQDLSLSQALWSAGAALGLLFLARLLTAAQTARVSVRAVDGARRMTMGAFLEARFDLQAAERASRLQELLSNHVNRIGTTALTATVGVSAAVTFLAFVAATMLITLYSAVIIGLATVLFGTVLLPLTRLTRRLSQRQADLNSDYASNVSQIVGAAKETRVFGVTERVRSQLAEQSRHTAAAGYSMQILTRMTPTFYQTIALLVLLLCLAGAYAFEISGIADLGTVVVLLVRAISYGQFVNTAIQYTSEAAPYLEDLRHKERALREGRVESGTTTTPVIEEIAFDGVSYSYDSGQPVLNDVSLRLRRGQKVGLVGPSGSGKSTLVQLLLRLREPSQGTISVNGVDVRELSLDSWFDKVALVPQDNVILQATVADNILFFRDDDRAAVIAAAKAAHLDDVITALPMGYETLIGPGHQELSGGQRQRLGLARAFLRRPELIVLDEPTSALDMDSEHLVQQTLQSLGDDVALLIVAHRLSTLVDCDAVMVLEAGRVVDVGTHEELLRSSPFYSRAVALSAGRDGLLRLPTE